MSTRFRPLLLTWAALLALLALTVGATFVPLGKALPLVNLGIAAAKAGLILWVFIGLARATSTARQMLGLAATMLIVLSSLLAADYATRSPGARLPAGSLDSSGGPMVAPH